MRTRQVLSVILIVVPLTLTSASFPLGGAPVSLIPDDVRASVRARVEGGLNMGIVVGVVSASGVEFYSEGHLSASRTEKVNEKTVFETGSVGKTFTALLLADAVRRGEMWLDDPIRKYLPKNVTVPTRFGKEITPLHLATHTSGLPSIPDNLAPADELNPYADYTVALLYEFLAGYRLPSLGTKYEYSNVGFGLLGHVLELRTGLTYEELLTSRIAKVLGMTSTVMTPTSVLAGRVATGYRDGEAFPRWDNPTLAGAGGGVSTAEDLALYLSANLGLVQTPLTASMAATHEPRVSAGDLRVGMAWHLRATPSGMVIEHHGATGGAWAYVGFIKKKQLGVVVLTNTYESIDDLGLRILDPTAALRVQGKG